MPPDPARSESFSSLLDPQALARIHRLELLARGVVEGFVSGRHRSPYKGFSVEFAEHREYAPGDDLRDLDWRVFGKTDRYYIKQYMEETNLRCTILLDASGSMGYAGKAAAPREGQPLSKYEYARLMAACLAHLLIGQQDAVGMVRFDTEVRRYFPARGQPGYLRALLGDLANADSGGETALAPVLHEVAERIRRRGLVILISDLFDEPEAILKALQHFRFRKHEVIVFHVMADEEREFPFEHWTEFRDMEQPQVRLELDPRSLAAAYRAEVAAFEEAIRQGCGRMKVDFVPVNTRLPFDETLVRFLSGRRRGAGKGGA
jgi:uncharacterized protein (DUF58 family)